MLVYTSGAAKSRYSSARSRGWRGQVWSSLTGRPRRLMSLSEVSRSCTVRARRHGGLQTVPIRQIRGSEGRCMDFDRDFNPLQSHSAIRWRSVEKGRKQGKSLPPVELVQVGDVYFVRDGHHRISVARAFGQRDIEAEVMAWQVTGSLPWESSGSPGEPKGGLLAKLGGESARLRERLTAAGAKLRGRPVSQAGAGA